MSHSGDQTPRPGPLLDLRRERVIDLLLRQVSSDAMTLEEFERRIEMAHRADSIAALDALVSDLAAPSAELSTDARPRPPASTTSRRREDQTLVAIMGGVSRKGNWRPAQRTRVIAIMGGAELDFRDIQLEPGVTEVQVIALMGAVEVIVPPGLAVDCNGIGIMGGFEHEDGASGGDEGDDPLLRISGIAFMGGAEVRVRLPGETAAEARRRRRDEQRALRRARRQLERIDRE